MTGVYKFTFLKAEKSHTKPNENGEVNDFLVVSLLDDELEQCKFMVFDEKVIQKITSSNFRIFQELLGSIHQKYYNNVWNIRLLELYADGNGKQ